MLETEMAKSDGDQNEIKKLKDQLAALGKDFTTKVHVCCVRVRTVQ